MANENGSDENNNYSDQEIEIEDPIIQHLTPAPHGKELEIQSDFH